MNDDIFDPDHIEDSMSVELAHAPEVDVDDDELDPGWEYERVEFFGDSLAVRVPSMNAITAFQVSATNYIPTEIQSRVTSKFIFSHIGPDSYDRVMTRMISPDEVDYPQNALPEVFNVILQLKLNALSEESAADA